ncbi:MAG: GGDEF domain-containing protein [Candidatus Woesearchaeota archaeon]
MEMPEDPKNQLEEIANAGLSDREKENLRTLKQISDLYDYYSERREEITSLLESIGLYEVMIDRNYERLGMRKEEGKPQSYDLDKRIPFTEALKSPNLIREKIDTYKNMINEMQKEHKRLETNRDELADEVDNLVNFDGLTGLYKREAFMNRVKQEIARSLRTGEEFTIAIGDIDHFGEYNNTYGHYPAGDEALKRVAESLNSSLRDEDIGERGGDYENQGGRMGGEEFMFLLYGVPKESAFDVVERMRKNVEDTRLPEYPKIDEKDTYSLMTSPDGKTPGKDSTSITISMGYTVFNPSDFEGMRPREIYDTIYRRADKALYAAKNTKNRNIVVEYSPEMENGGGAKECTS